MPTVDFRKFAKSSPSKTDSLIVSGEPQREPLTNETGEPLDFRKTPGASIEREPDLEASDIETFFNDAEKESLAPVENDGSSFSQWLSTDTAAQSLGLSTYLAKDKSPEAAAKVLSLSTQTGLPESVIEGNEAQVEQSEKLASFNVPDFAARSPIIAEWLSQSPNRVSATWRDLPQLQKLEETISDHSLLGAMREAFKGGVASTLASTARIPSLLYSMTSQSKFGRIAREALGPFAPSESPPDWLINNGAAKYFDVRAKRLTPPEVHEDVITEIARGNPGRAGRLMAVQFSANAPLLAGLLATAVVGQPAAGLALAGGVEGASSLKENLDKGLSPQAATVNATLRAGLEVGFERVGTFGVLKEWANAIAKKFGQSTATEVMKDVGKTLFYSSLSEGNEELWTSVFQDFADWATGANPQAADNLDKVLSWQALEVPLVKKALGAGLLGAVSGAAMTGPSATLLGIARASQAEKAARQKEFYTSLGQTAEAMEIRKTLPQAQKEIIEGLTKDSPVEKIYLSPEVIDTYFQAENPVKVMTALGVLESYDEAKTTGGDVAIPLATWVEKVVGTPAYEALANDIKFSPTDLSVNEAKALKKEVEAQAKKAEMETLSDPATERAEVFSQQLEAAGQDPAASVLFERMLRQTAKEAGIDVEALRPLTVTAEPEPITEPEAHVFEQAKRVDGTNIVDATEDFQRRQVKKTKKQMAEEKAAADRLAKEVEEFGNEGAARFAARFRENEPKAREAIKKAQTPKKGPYVTSKAIPGIGWVPNFAAEPKGVIGPARISEPLSAKETDPLKWADLKYGVTKALIKKHKDQNIPLVINTSSDLVAHEDYIAVMPQNTTVNMYLLPPEPLVKDFGDRLVRVLFPGSPSRQRQEEAITHLRKAGITVNAIEPSAEDVLKVIDKRKAAKSLGVKLKDLPSELKKMFPVVEEVKEEPSPVISAADRFEKRREEIASQPKKELSDYSLVKLNEEVDGINESIDEGAESPEDLDRLDEIIEALEEKTKTEALAPIATPLADQLAEYRKVYDVIHSKEKLNLTVEEAIKLSQSENMVDVARAAMALEERNTESALPRKEQLLLMELANRIGEFMPNVKAMRYGTPTGNLWVAKVSKNGEEVTGVGPDKTLAIEEAFLGGLQFEEMSPHQLMSTTDRKTMLVVGANSFLRNKVPFFLLQGHDIHLLFHPQNKSHWKVGIVSMSRTNPAEAKYASVTATDINQAIDKAIGALLAQRESQSGEVSEEESEKLAKKNTWFTQWLYKSPKISLKDVLALEPYPTKEFEQGPRGRIQFFNNEAIIQLSKWSDPSTVPHEMAHYFLEVLGELATQDNATDAIKKRYAEALTFLGVTTRSEITRDHHEKFARAFEAYLREGKAPSSALREIFARFKAWLLEIYQSAALETLTPEIRRFFDTLLASEEEIADAQAQQTMAPLFTDLKAAGLNDPQALAYATSVEQARQAAELDITNRIAEQESQKLTKEYQEKREQTRALVEEEVNQDKTYIAISVLQKGKLPDGSELPEGLHGLKIDKASLSDLLSKDEMKSLPRPYVYAKEGGLHVDIVADMLGFGSGAELIANLKAAEPREALIERLTNDRMGAEVQPLSLAVEAMKAVHNDQQAELYRKELDHLASEEFAKFKKLTRRVARPLPKIETVRAQAQAVIAKRKVREINPFLYQRAESKAGREALDLFLKGDIEGAFSAKQRQLFNHELYRAATAAREEVEGIVAYVARFSKLPTRERLGKAGADYLEQIDSLLERYDFRRLSLKVIDKKKTLLEWVKSQEQEGFSVNIPEHVLFEANREHYRNLPYEKLIEIKNTIAQIDHLARLKNKLLANEKHRAMEEAKAELLSTLQAHHKLDKTPEDLSKDFKDKIVSGTQQFLASHTRMEFLFEYLDGGKAHGAFWNFLFKPFVDAENRETELAKQDTERLGEIFSVYAKSERVKWFTHKFYVPEIATDKVGANITKAEAMAVALNWGNEYNRQALKEGYGWSDFQVQKILDLLDERDWKTVQALWDHINTYWEASKQLEQDMTGIAPAKVEASPVTTKYGVFKGGYYPIKFNGDRSYRDFQLQEKEALGQQFGHATRAMTRHGHLIERTNTGGKPLLLSLTVLTQHLAQVRHDITHRRAVVDVAKLVNDKAVREGIEATAGRAMYRQLNPWLHAIAGDTPLEVLDGWEKLLGRARSGATVVNLGFKLTSGIVQVLGYLNSVNELGIKYAALGLKAANPFELKENWNFVKERSTMMANRLDNYDRDIRDYVRKQSAVLSIDAAWFYHIGVMDLALSIPTWLGAYQKAMDGNIENIEKGQEKAAIDYADSVVRKTMAAGAAKDLAAVQRGNELKRLFTAFYSQLNLQFNLLQQTGQRYSLDKNIGKLVSGFVLLWVMQAVLDDLLKGKGPEEDEEWLPWLLRKSAFFPLQTIVLGRDLVSAIDRKIETGRRADFTPTPALQAFEALVDAAVPLATKPLSEEEFTRQDVKNTVMAVGYFAKLPTRQAWMTLEYFYDWMTGNVEPESPMEGLAQALITGKKKER